MMLPSPGKVPRGRSRKAPAGAGDAGPSPGSERSPGGANGTPLQCSCRKTLVDRVAWWATVHGVAKSPVSEHINRQSQVPMMLGQDWGIEYIIFI